jgi:3-deoxy-D-manno-octulosonic-acid transferase
MFNFAEITDLFSSQYAMLQVSDEQALANILIQLADDAAQRKSLGDRAYAVMQANGGALQKQTDAIADFINPRSR